MNESQEKEEELLNELLIRSWLTHDELDNL